MPRYWESWDERQKENSFKVTLKIPILKVKRWLWGRSLSERERRLEELRRIRKEIKQKYKILFDERGEL